MACCLLLRHALHIWPWRLCSPESSSALFCHARVSAATTPLQRKPRCQLSHVLGACFTPAQAAHGGHAVSVGLQPQASHHLPGCRAEGGWAPVWNPPGSPHQQGHLCAARHGPWGQKLWTRSPCTCQSARVGRLPAAVSPQCTAFSYPWAAAARTWPAGTTYHISSATEPTSPAGSCCAKGTDHAGGWPHPPELPKRQPAGEVPL